jgi:3-hydroxyisobutyrate dehydrogenase-like beta-hydroxyacid dehydrogenase
MAVSEFHIGVIGAGLMGAGMAHSLLRNGCEVHVVAHRQREPIDRLIAEGAHEHPDAAALADACPIIMMCLPNADVVSAVMEAITPELVAGNLVIDTTTSLPRTSRMWEQRLRPTGIRFVDAPVTGGPAEAMRGALRSLVGADQETYDLVLPILRFTSQHVARFGPVGSGHGAKLINNGVTLANTALTIEAMRRCDALGVDRDEMFTIMSMGAARSGTMMAILPPALEGDYDGQQFSLQNALKDVSYVREVSRDAGEDSPIVEALVKFYARELETWPPDVFVSRLLGPPLAE